MAEKRTVVSQIEITESGAIQLRLEKQVIENGEVLVTRYHRTVIEPGIDVADQVAEVNRHIVSTGDKALGANELERIKRMAAVVHTPEVVTAFGKFRDAAHAVDVAQAALTLAAKEDPNSQAAIAASEALQRAHADAVKAYRDAVETVRMGA